MSENNEDRCRIIREAIERKTREQREANELFEKERATHSTRESAGIESDFDEDIAREGLEDVLAGLEAEITRLKGLLGGDEV